MVPRAVLFPRATPHGFLPLAPEELEARFLAPARREGFFVERRWAETHPEVQQPIPYVVVRRRGEAEPELLALTRLPTQGEARLHGRRSIGVGGHINPCDQPAGPDGGDLFQRACVRELQEELVLPDPLATDRLRPLGLLKDDTTEVGAVHVGLVYEFDAAELPLAIRETSAMTGGFEALSRLVEAARGEPDPFETWSSLLLRSGALAQKAPRPGARSAPTSLSR